MGVLALSAEALLSCKVVSKGCDGAKASGGIAFEFRGEHSTFLNSLFMLVGVMVCISSLGQFHFVTMLLRLSAINSES